MRNREISKKIAKASLGIFATVTDLVLFTMLMLIEAGLHPGDAHSMIKLERRLDRLFFEGKDRIIRNAIYQGKHRGWLKEDLKLTEEGKKRLWNFLPVFLPPKKWNSKWYLVIFDIPEKMKRKRNILREYLKKLGFGQLQASVWLSPVNYLENVEKIVEFLKLEPYVIFSETDKLGRDDSRVLANKVWRLEKLNEEYAKFISEWEKTGKKERFWLRFKFFSILKKDPQLPKELLPENWLGEKANQLVNKSE